MTTIAFISDTHGHHRDVNIPPVDLLIHCGDWSRSTDPSEWTEFLDWMVAQPAKSRVLVAGNHDFLCTHLSEPARMCADYGVVYLRDEESTVEGLRIYGSPWTPQFGRWAFMGTPKEMSRHWSRIPSGLDILVTHGPPEGVLDMTARGVHAGCPRLMRKIREVKPKVHAFGHIHEAAGALNLGDTHFINAAVVNLAHKVIHGPSLYTMRVKL